MPLSSSSNIVLKWCKIIIKLTILILILSTPAVAEHFITRTPIYITHFLTYLFNIILLLISLIVKDILINGLQIFCDKIIRGILILLVIIVPVFFWLPSYDTFDLAKLTIMYSLNSIILGIWLIKAIASKEVKLCRTPLDIPILAFLAINILSTLTSVSPCISLFGFYKRFEGLLPITNYIFLFYVVVNFMNTPKFVARLIKTMIFTATAISIYGIFQHFDHDPFKWSFSAKERVFGTFGNPVFFSAYLIMTIPLGLAIFLLREKLTQAPLHLKNVSLDKKREKVKKIPHKSKKVKKKEETESHYQELFLTWTKIFNTCKNIWVVLFNFLSPWWYRISIILLFICFLYTKTRATIIGFEGGIFIFYLLICGLLFSFTFYGTITLCTFLGFIILLKYLSTTHIVTLLLGGIFIGLFSFGPLIFKSLFSKKWMIKNKIEASILALILIGITISFNINPETSVVGRVVGTIIKTEASPQIQLPSKEEKKELTDIECRIQQALPTPEIKFTAGAQEERVKLWQETIKVIVKNSKNFILGIGLDALQLMNIGTDKAHNDFLDITVTRGIIGLILYLWLLISYIVISLKISFKEVDINKKLLIAAFLTCELGYLIQNQFSFGLVTILSHFWIVMGMTMVVIKPQMKDSKQTIITPRIKNLPVRITLYMLIMGITIVLIYLAFHPFRADVYYRKGFDFVERRSYEEGVPGLEKAVEIFPYETCYWKVLNSIYVERANYYSQNNDSNKTKMWVEKAIEGSKFLLTLIPKDTGSYFNMGMAYYLDGNYLKAISSYKKVLAIAPDHTDTLNNLATIYAKQGEYKKAEELFKKVLKQRPDYISSKNNLIQLYKIQGRYKEAAELDADYAKQMHLGLTQSYYKKGDIDKAIEEIKKVIAIDPNDIQSIRNLGSFYMLKNKYTQAKDEFNKVLKLDPNDEYAKGMLENINRALH
ncbi:MAG: tetratricopeptide repeat protein [bacterium]